MAYSADKKIISRAAKYIIVSSATSDYVIASVALDNVTTFSTTNKIIAALPVKMVVTG